MSRLNRLTVVAVIGAVVVSGLVAPPSSADAAPKAAATPAAGSIQHVIVVIQSGHSFDNYFGTRAGVDGIPAGVCQPVAAGSTTCVKPYHVTPDQARAGLSNTARSMSKAVDGGKMNGFVSAQPNTSIGTAAMGYYNRQDLPYYWGLADHFTLFDHFFAGTLGGALPNRLYAVAAQDANVTSTTAPAGGVKVPTIFDRLDQAGLSWKYYVQGYQAKQAAAPTVAEKSRTPLLAMPAVTGSPALAARITNTNQYFTDLINHQLPAVSYVTGSAASERSPQDPATGEAFVRSLISALMQQPTIWAHTALLLTYDDAGGWYDHVVPPKVGGVSLGLRVPALLISPFARAGFVDHTEMDTSSIPGLVEQVFHLRPLTRSDALAGSLLGAVNLHGTPTPAYLGASPDPPATIVRPAVGTIYVLYLLALGLTALLIALAFVRGRRSGRSSPGAPSVAGAPT